MKKKLLAALMAVTLAASMTACGAPQAVDDDKDSKDTAQTEEKKNRTAAKRQRKVQTVRQPSP